MGELPHRQLFVWQQAYALARDVCTAFGRNHPAHRELTHQTVRAALSIPANIAEGHGRGTNKDFAAFVIIARGSLYELDTFIRLAADLGCIDRIAERDFTERCYRLNGLIHRLLKSLRNETAVRRSD